MTFSISFHCEGKGKVHPIICYEGPVGTGGIEI
jgi:hypothetical protein